MELELTGKRKKGQLRKLWEGCVKKDMQRYGLRKEDAYNQVKWQNQIKIKIVNPARQDNGIKMDVVAVVVMSVCL